MNTFNNIKYYNNFFLNYHSTSFLPLNEILANLRGMGRRFILREASNISPNLFRAMNLVAATMENPDLRQVCKTAIQ